MDGKLNWPPSKLIRRIPGRSTNFSYVIKVVFGSNGRLFALGTDHKAHKRVEAAVDSRFSVNR
jgi:hypothetical protein